MSTIPDSAFALSDIGIDLQQHGVKKLPRNLGEAFTFLNRAIDIEENEQGNLYSYRNAYLTACGWLIDSEPAIVLGHVPYKELQQFHAKLWGYVQSGRLVPNGFLGTRIKELDKRMQAFAEQHLKNGIRQKNAPTR